MDKSVFSNFVFHSNECNVDVVQAQTATQKRDFQKIRGYDYLRKGNGIYLLCQTFPFLSQLKAVQTAFDGIILSPCRSFLFICQGVCCLSLLFFILFYSCLSGFFPTCFISGSLRNDSFSELREKKERNDTERSSQIILTAPVPRQ